MADINKCIFTGRVGNDIELRMTQGGIPTCTFSLAVDRPRPKDKDADRETDWLTIVAWRSTAELCYKHLCKGKKVAVEAVARTRKWEDKDGRPHKVVEFQMMDFVLADNKQQSPSTTGDESSTKGNATPKDIEGNPQDGDLPF